MRTPKQTKAAYKRIRFHLYQLQRALTDAHTDNILRYDDYQTQSPCKSLYEALERIEDTMKDALYEAAKEEVMQELRKQKVW